jgi:hypothetical protein
MTESQSFCNRILMLHSRCILHHKGMSPQHSSLLAQAFSWWNWKCALLSATVRSLVYLAAMAHSGPHGRLAVVLVEVAYVSLTAGIYAGMQQRALGLRARWLGNLIVVLGVPALAQTLDWLAHRVSGAAAPGRAILAVSIFAAFSALFHLHVMRNGAFLTGCGRSLFDDFRHMPGLVAGFIVKPVAIFVPLVRFSNGCRLKPGCQVAFPQEKATFEGASQAIPIGEPL